MTCRQRLEAYFRENRVPYETQHHPVAFTAQEVAATGHVSGKLLVKVVMAMVDGLLTMLVVPAPRAVNWKKVANAFGARDVRLAKEEEFAGAFPDCEVGAMPPFGSLYDFRTTYLDRALAEELSEANIIYFQAGTHTDTMSMRYEDYARLAHPVISDLTA